MKLDVTLALKDVDGERLKDGKTLRDICIFALSYENESKSVDEAVKKYNLIKDFKSTKKEIELVAEDIILLKKAVAKIYKPFIGGQVCLILDGKE